MLPWIEVLFFNLSSLFFAQEFLLLLLCECLAIETDELALKFLDLFVFVLFIINAEVRVFLDHRHFFVVQGLLEFYLDISFDHAYLIFGLAIHDVYKEVSAVVVDVDCVSLHQARVVG